ncbi:MAG: 23S rRNA (uracil(1939)-C(5))-methyltransferase RlmD, partial [Moraxellaceae bacterium]
MSNRNGNDRGSDKTSGGSKKPGFKLGQKPRASKSVDKTFAFETDDRPRMHKPRAEKQTQPQNDMRLGEFIIERMGHDGRGITQWNGKTLFVDGAMTGERISARLVQEHSRYAEARVDKLLEPSLRRENPVCVHYTLCGGCQVQHIHSAEQLALKEQVVVEQLERWGGVKAKHMLPPITSPATGYRRSARLGVWYEDEFVTLGFRKRNSKQLVEINDCAVLVPELNRLLAPLKSWLVELRSAKPVTHIEFIRSDNRSVIVLRHTKPLAAADLQNLTILAVEYDFDAFLQGSDARQLQDLHGNNVDPRLTYTLADFNLELTFHPQDFIQVNSSVNAQMVA